MKRDLGNFTRGSQLIEHFGFMFAAGLKGPLIIALIVMCWLTWWTVSEGMSDHEVYLAWMHVYGVGYRFMEFDPRHDVAVKTAWGRTVTFPISLLDVYPPVLRACSNLWPTSFARRAGWYWVSPCRTRWCKCSSATPAFRR
ncbi:MAG: hypothetical protein WCL10_18570 [Novosphingobium sp.]|uniref:hypothetical protein n=1 Tax=Novosphingobium sp. TaxID=1874826 RepID=UPI003017F265